MHIVTVIDVPVKGGGYPDGGRYFLGSRPVTAGFTLECQLALELLHTEGAGATIHDTSPFLQDMTAIHAPVWSVMPGGQFILTYDGLNDYLTRAAFCPDLDFTTESFTFLVWCYPNVSASDMVLSQGRVNVCGYEFYLTETVNTISLRTNQAGSHTGISAIGYMLPARWQLIGVTRNRAGGQFYVNGLAVPTTLGAGLLDPVSAAGHNFQIGRGEMGNYYTGSMSIVKIWSRELAASEIKTVFDSERSLFGA